MSDGALDRARLVRGVAELLSTDEPMAALWPRCADLLAELAGAQEVTLALRDDVLPAGSLAADVLNSGETTIRSDGTQLAIGVPIHFGHTLFGATCLERIVSYDATLVTLLESCALYLGARLYHEGALENSARYARMALTDSLTGVPNRRSFDDAFAREWARAYREDVPLAVLMLDLDYFKGYNDAYGHQAGDACLQRIASAFVERIKRPGDSIARYGGEEFVALLPGTSLDGAIALAEELRAAIAALGIESAASSLGHMTVSIGVAAETPSQAGSPAALLRAADDALYRAKLGGRNRVYARGYESAAELVRPRRASGRSGLPVSLTRLIGRRSELGQSRMLLSTHRLLSIVGTGGTGKTRIAIAIASEIAERYDGGARFVDFSSLGDPGLVAGTIAKALDGQVEPGERAIEELAALLSERPTLLVLDNCEHLVAEISGVVRALLEIVPQLAVVATSREPLGIAGEAVYRLPLLSLPAPNAEPTAAAALAFDAVALFVERATEAKRDFALTEENVASVVRICRDVDGIALAVELAASRVGTIGLHALAERLRDFRLLGSGDRSAVPRQQTMHAAIGWSFHLLTEPERALFRRLAIFAGGFTFDAAREAAAFGIVERDEVFELLSSLIRKSLVAEDAVHEGRYRLLESIRAYARERLVDAGELQTVARRHAEFFDEYARRTDATFRVTESRAWLDAVMPDADNLRAAMEWALDERADVALGISIVASSINFFNDCMRGEASRWTRKALEALRPGVPAETRARLLRGVAITRLFTAPETRAAAEGAVELYRSLGDRTGLADALRGLAQTIGWYFREERELADALACEAIEIARELGDPILLALSLRTRGLTIDIADMPQKRAILLEAIELIRAHGNDRTISSLLTWISDLEFSAGEAGRAMEYGREALSYAERSGSDDAYAGAARNLAGYAAALGDWETAKRSAIEALRFCRRTHNVESVTFCVQTLAVVAIGIGRFEDAARLLGFCDARAGVLHPHRQADQLEDQQYRYALPALREVLGAAELERLMREGATLTDDEAFSLASSL